jgi:hypothetical protein
MLLSQNITLIIFIVLIVGAAIISFAYRSYIKYDKGSIHIFFSILTGLGVIVTFMFYYNLVELQWQQQQLIELQEANRIDTSLSENVLKEIKKASLIIPNFIHSLHPLTNTLCNDGVTSCLVSLAEDPTTVETHTLKMIVSCNIFSSWKDMITTNKVISLSPKAYVADFLQKASSKQLYAQWMVAKINYNTHVQQFGDLLFEYASNIIEQTPNAYEKAAETLVLDPRFTSIHIKG